MSALALQNLEPALTSPSLGERQEPLTSPTAKAGPALEMPPYLRSRKGTAAPSLEAEVTRAEDRDERATRQILAHHWECTVESIGSETFSATLRSLLKPGDTEKEAELPLDEVSPDDQELLAPGAIFYWTIGSERSPKGTISRFSRIKFRRLPGWTRRDLATVEEEAKRLFAMFGGDDARDEAGER